MLTATFDGTFVTVYKNGRQIGRRRASLRNDVSTVSVLPPDAWDGTRKADGEVQKMTVWGVALPPNAVGKLFAQGRG
jgi:hypothetical protein